MIRTLLIVCVLALVTACGNVGPADIDTATDVCARCHMSIDTVAHAAEIVTAEGDIRKYDSLGCLLEDYRELTAAGRRVAGAWVVDYSSRKWVRAEAAAYALANLATDHMGFGAVATTTREAALKIVGGEASKVVDWQHLLARR